MTKYNSVSDIKNEISVLVKQNNWKSAKNIKELTDKRGWQQVPAKSIDSEPPSLKWFYKEQERSILYPAPRVWRDEIIPGLFLGQTEAVVSFYISTKEPGYSWAAGEELLKDVPSNEYGYIIDLSCSRSKYEHPKDFHLFLEIEDRSTAFDKLRDFFEDPLYKNQIGDMLCEGKDVLVNCSIGASRSVSYTILYLMTVGNIGFLDAYYLLQEKRPEIGPTFGFIAGLLKYEKELIEQGAITNSFTLINVNLFLENYISEKKLPNFKQVDNSGSYQASITGVKSVQSRQDLIELITLFELAKINFEMNATGIGSATFALEPQEYLKLTQFLSKKNLGSEELIIPSPNISVSGLVDVDNGIPQKSAAPDDSSFNTSLPAPQSSTETKVLAQDNSLKSGTINTPNYTIALKLFLGVATFSAMSLLLAAILVPPFLFLSVGVSLALSAGVGVAAAATGTAVMSGVGAIVLRKARFFAEVPTSATEQNTYTLTAQKG